MKTLTFSIALGITAFGAVGILIPSITAWIAHHAATPNVFYLVAAIRIAFGFLLIAVAPKSRAPKTLRVIGCFVLIAGVAAALIGLLAIERARLIIEWWLQKGTGILRLTGAVLIIFGGFIAYACAPAPASKPADIHPI